MQSTEELIKDMRAAANNAMWGSQYYAELFRKAAERLADYHDVKHDWPKLNRRRAALLDKEAAGTASPAELIELERLQYVAGLRVELERPQQLDVEALVLELAQRTGRLQSLADELLDQKPRLEQLEEEFQPGLPERRLADDLLDAIQTYEAAEAGGGDAIHD